MKGVNVKIKLGTVVNSISNIRFHGMKIVQNEDFTYFIKAEDKKKYWNNAESLN